MPGSALPSKAGQSNGRSTARPWSLRPR